MRIPILLCAVVVLARAQGQWSTDPAAPLQVCGTAGAPTNLRVLSDGASGWFAFWTDKRTDQTNREIYGQHLDAEGVALWPTNGKLIHTEPGSSIEELAADVLGNGDVMIAYLFRPAMFQDTLKAIAIDIDGDPAWPAPVHITQCGSPILSLGDLRVTSTPGGAYIAWYDTYFGGSTGVNVTRITSSGVLPWGIDGYAVPGASYGPYEIHSDHATGLILQWRTGNGSGAALMAMRVDSSGTNVWPANVQTSAGSGGLNYAFHTAQDEFAAQLTAWVDMPHLIVMARLDTTGALTFSPSPVSVCTFSSDQDIPRVVLNEGYTFVGWVDNRPPAANRDLYLQKLDADGTPLWDADGVLAIQLNSYIPTTGLVASDSAAVIATMDANVTGYSAIRIRGDATPAWPAPVQFCTPAFNPFYAAQSQFADGEGGIVSFWQTNSGAIHAARIYRNGLLGSPIGIEEIAPMPVLQVHPNPCGDRITITLPEVAGMDRWTIMAMDGRVIMEGSAQASSEPIDVSSLASGTYLVQAAAAGRLHTQRFVRQ